MRRRAFGPLALACSVAACQPASRRRASRSWWRASTRCTSSPARWRATAPRSSPGAARGRAPRLGALAAGRRPGQKARVFVYNGAGFEPWVDKLLKDVPGGGATVVVDATEARSRSWPAAPPWIPTSGSIPCSPRRRSRPSAPRSSRPIRRTRPPTRTTPAPSRERLAALDERSSPAFATARAARSCLARLLRLPRPALPPHPGAGHGAGPRFRAEPGRAGRDRAPRPAPARSRYIFFETLVSPRLAETLAREVGARTLVLNPIEGLTKEEAAAGKGYVDADGGQPREPAHGARVPVEPASAS